MADFWTIAGVAVALLIGLATIWATYSGGTPRRRLFYGMLRATPLLTAPSGIRGELELRHRGTVLSDPQIVDIRLITRGRRDIPSTCYDQNTPLEIDFSSRILEVLKATSDATSIPKPKTAFDGATLKIGPSLLCKRQRMDYSLLIDGRPTLTCNSSLIDVEVSELSAEELEAQSITRHLTPTVIAPIIVIPAAVVLQFWLVSTGILYAAFSVQASRLAVLGIALCALTVPYFISQRNSKSPRSSPLYVLAVVAAVAVVLYSADDLFLPSSPAGFTANPCPGTPVLGSVLYAQTLQMGVNSRLGPGEQYAQANRFVGNCVLGFDGFCVGSAVPDLRTGLPDQLWLVLHRRHEFISDAVLLLQSPGSLIGRQPLASCLDMGGLPMPRPITSLHFDPRTKQLTSMARNAAIVGYAGLLPGNRMEPIGIATFPSHFSAKWNNFATAISSGQIIIEAVDCLASQVPVIGTSKTLSIQMKDGSVVNRASSPAIPANDRTTLSYMACNAG